MLQLLGPMTCITKTSKNLCLVKVTNITRKVRFHVKLQAPSCLTEESLPALWNDSLQKRTKPGWAGPL